MTTREIKFMGPVHSEYFTDEQIEYVINDEVVKKLVTTIDAGLCTGVGEPTPGEMCIEAAVCYAIGLPHGDEPNCVAPSLRSFKISLNDAEWSSREARAQGLKRLGIAQLGSYGTLDEVRFRKLIKKQAIKLIGRAVNAVADIIQAGDSGAGETSIAVTALTRAGSRCQCEYDARSVLFARDELLKHSPDQEYLAWSGILMCLEKSSSASCSDIADAVIEAATAIATGAEYYQERFDQVLSEFCECVVTILQDMEAPGCQWLDLADYKAPEPPVADPVYPEAIYEAETSGPTDGFDITGPVDEESFDPSTED